MAQWGKNAQQNNAPLWDLVVAAPHKTKNTSNRTSLYQNTTVSGYVTGMVVGEFAVSANNHANGGGEVKKVAHSGWNLRREKTGSVLSITSGATGNAYTNTDLFVIVAPSGGTNAGGTIATDGNGTILTFTLTSKGKGFNSTTANVLITNSSGGNSAGSNATSTVTFTESTGRVMYETLVAMKNIGSTNTTIIPS